MSDLHDRVFSILVVGPQGNFIPGASIIVRRDGIPKTQMNTANGPATVQLSAQKGRLEVEVSYPPLFHHIQAVDIEAGSLIVTIPDISLRSKPIPSRKWLLVCSVLLAAVIFVTALLNRGILPVGKQPFKLEAAGYMGNHPPYNKRVAVVFVHGIFGDNSGSWLNGEASFPKLLDTDPVFSKETDVFLFEFFSPYFGSASSIPALAKQLGGSLEDNHVFEDHKSVIFLSHSMGGLVVRQYLLLKRNIDKVAMLYFYATPTNGSELTTSARSVSSNPQLRGMLPLEGNDLLQTVHDSWINWREVANVPSYCAYETLPTKGIWIVPQSSAEALCNQESDPMTADHITIVKPPNRSDPRYSRFTTAMRKSLAETHIAPVDKVLARPATSVSPAEQIRKDRDITSGQVTFGCDQTLTVETPSLSFGKNARIIESSITWANKDNVKAHNQTISDIVDPVDHHITGMKGTGSVAGLDSQNILGVKNCPGGGHAELNMHVSWLEDK